jgi:hypothetical protein
MEDFDFRTFAVSEHQQLHIDALAELKERIHTPGAVSTADLIKVLDNTAKSTGLVKEDKGSNIGVIHLSFEYGGIKLETTPEVAPVEQVTDVEPRPVDETPQAALEAPPDVPQEVDDFFSQITSHLENL